LQRSAAAAVKLYMGSCVRTVVRRWTVTVALAIAFGATTSAARAQANGDVLPPDTAAPQPQPHSDQNSQPATQNAVQHGIVTPSRNAAPVGAPAIGQQPQTPAGTQPQGQPGWSNVTPPTAPQAPLDMPPQAPRVNYVNGQLTIRAENSTLADVLNAVRARTGTPIDVPPSAMTDRVAVHLGPAPPREVLSALLDGSNFNYVILGSEQNPESVQRVVLTPRSPESANANPPQPMQRPPMQVDNGDDNDQDVPDTAIEEPAPPPMVQPIPPQPGATVQPGVQPGVAQQPGVMQQPGVQPNQTAPVQPGENPQQQQQQSVKTPEQLLQELQELQRRQQQQQQQGGNPGNPSTPR
jgi:hypothetical protein